MADLWILQFFNHAKTKNEHKLFNMQDENQDDSSILTWNIVVSRIMQSDWPIVFSITTNYIFTNHSFFKSYASGVGGVPKMKLFINFSWDIADLRILQSDWFRAFWLITPEPEFSQIWDLCRHKANNQKTLKTLTFGHFTPILPIFG